MSASAHLLSEDSTSLFFHTEALWLGPFTDFLGMPMSFLLGLELECSSELSYLGGNTGATCNYSKFLSYKIITIPFKFYL